MDTRPITEPAGRWELIEQVRFIAALGIVAFHVGCPLRALSLAGLPAFTTIAVAFAARGAGRRPWREGAWRRVQQIGVPWAAWFLIYGALASVRSLRRGGELLAWFRPSVLLYGPSIHLWFLPFILAVTLAGAAAAPWLRGRALVPWALLAGTVVLIPASAWMEQRDWDTPYVQWATMLPALALGLWLGVRADAGPAPMLRTVLPAALVGGVAAVTWLAWSSTIAGAYAFGAPACVLAWASRRPASRLTVRLSSWCYGMYLAHPLVLIVTYKAVSAIDTEWWPNWWMRWAAAAGGSIAVVVAVRAIRLRGLV